MSLRTRLLVGLAFVAIVLGLTTFFVTRTTSAHLLEQVDSQLASASTSGRERFGNKPYEADERPSLLFYAELFPDGELRERLKPNIDGDADDVPEFDVQQLLATESEEPFTVTTESGSEWHVLVTDGPGHLEVTALPLDDLNETVQRLIIGELIAAAGVLGAMALVGWWVMRLGVRPIKQMTAVAAEIAEGDMSHRVPLEPASTEAGQLGAALNKMLATIEDAFEERTNSEDRLKQFVADASHELRTPIATVRGYAELYRRGGLDAGPELDDAMRRTEEEAIRMGGLVDDLLHLARLDQGRPLERRPVRLDRLVTDAVHDARAMAPDRDITSSVLDEVVVTGDEARLRQVIANLLANARVHTPATSQIDVRVRNETSRVVLEVADQGPGMPPDIAARVFERFYRADKSRSRQAGGSGLGLAIVRSTVEAHGGTVSLVSSLERGTVVTVSLPRTNASTSVTLS